MFDVYRPSGSVGTLTFPLILVGSLLAVAMAYLYQLLLHWIPFIYISFLITIGMGTALGMMAAWITHTGHVRNTLVAGLIGIVLAACGLSAKYWFQYQGQLGEVTTSVLDENKLPETSRAEIKEQIAQQFTFLRYIETRTGIGWNIGRGGGVPISGIFVYAIWLIEAIIICYLATMPARSVAAGPYSETTARWADESQVVMTLPVTDPEMVTKIQTATMVDELLDIPIPKTYQSNQFAVYTVNSIPGEELEDAYVSVQLVTSSMNAKGEEESSEESLVQHAILPSAKRIQLIENAELMQEAMEDYRASLEAQPADTPDDIASESTDSEEYR